ncbi:MAG TPA: hypothetical protein VES36_00110, partial [Candidatus Limnocylindrales bacterium]|nr:hypothetical protein [Candidatus Limnocylindrales bacterium]
MTAQDDRPTRQRALRGPLVGSVAVATMAVCLYLFGAGATVAAPAKNVLLNGNVNPNSGTTNTKFEFIVRYQSVQGNAPTSVTAVIGNVVVPLSLFSGSPADGRYRGTAKLPARTRQVTFQATARGNDPTLDGPTVTVTKAPTPSATPRPTPVPTVAAPPSAAPQTTAPTTPAPATNAPTDRPRRETPKPTPRETGLAGGGLATPTPEATADPAAGGGTDTERQLVTILTGGLIAIGALALIGVFALLRDRRRRSR